MFRYYAADFDTGSGKEGLNIEHRTSNTEHRMKHRTQNTEHRTPK